MNKQFVRLIISLGLAGFYTSIAAAAEYSLADLYRQALKNSEQIRLAEENVFISQMGKSKAWSLLIPKLTASGGYIRYTDEKYIMGDPARGLLQPQNAETWSVRAEQTFSVSARELNALKAAGQTITKSEYDLGAAKTDYVLAVATSYYDVLKARKALEIATANMARLTQYRNAVEKRVKVGEQTKTALLRASGELSGARADYIRATNILQLARAALVRVTGVEEDFRLKEEAGAASGAFELGHLRKTAFESRLDLKSSDMQTQIAAEQVKYARGAFWPSVGVFAVYAGADQNSATAALNRESIYGGVSLVFPFFEGGLRVAELKEARARERQAQLVYEDLKKSVDIELQGVYLELETQKSAMIFLEDQLNFARDNYDDIVRQYTNGLANTLDVMDANSLLLSSERNYNEVVYNYQLAQLKVRRADGTLLQFLELQK